MPNYDYANGTGLTALAKRTFEKIKSKITTDIVTSDAGNPIVIETDAAQYAKKTHLTLEPIQDLHGYDHPWPAGGGKNLLPMTVDDIKAATTVTWSGNSITINGVTFTILTDSAGNITGIKANGTASGVALLQISPEMYFTEGQKLSGITNATGDGIGLGFSGVGMVVTNPDYTISASLASTKRYLYVRVDSGYTANNVIFYPMIRLASESDATFAPYSNICPITPMGHRNLLQVTAQSQTINGVTFTVNDDGTITANGTATATAVLFLNGSFEITDNARYVYSGITGGASDAYRLECYWRDSSSSNKGAVFLTSGEIAIGVSDKTDAVKIDTFIFAVVSGATVNNVTVRPMVRIAYDLFSDFVPYGAEKIMAKVTGKNLLKNELKTKTVNGVTFTTNEDGSISLSGTATVNTLNVFVGTVHSDKALILNGYRGNWSSPGIVFHCYESGTTTPEYSTAYGYIELPAGKIYDVSISVRQSVNTTGHIIYPMVRYAGVTDDAYEPYTESVSSLDLPEPVYGGTLDLETGEVVADMGMVDLGTLTWGYASGENRFYALLSSIKSYGYSEIPNIICSQYKTNAWDVSVNGDVFSASGYISVKDNSYNDAATFKTAMSGVQLCYELATPITYRLTPAQLDLLKGTNVITVNGKTIQVTYREGALATLEELNAISFDLSNVKSKLPPIIIKDGMLQVTYDDGQ